MNQIQRERLRQLPAMDEVLSLQSISCYESRLGRKSVKSVVSDVIGEFRKSILEGNTSPVSLENIHSEIEKRLRRHSRRSPRKVINLSLIHI